MNWKSVLQAFRNGSTRIQHKNNIWLVFSNQEHSQKHNLGRKREHHILLMFIQCMQLKKKRTISGKFCLDLELLREYQSPFATIVTIASVPQLAWDEKSLSLLWLLLLELRPGLKKHALT